MPCFLYETKEDTEAATTADQALSLLVTSFYNKQTRQQTLI